MLLFLFLPTEGFSKTSVTLTFTGDIIPHDNLIIDNHQKKVFNTLLKNFHHIFTNDNFTIINLESPIIHDLKPNGYPTFNSPASIINAFKNNSIECINLANNHILDYGSMGLYKTIKILNKNNINFLGIKPWPRNPLEIKIYKINNKKIGIIAATSLINIPIKNKFRDYSRVSTISMKNHSQLKRCIAIIKKQRPTCDFLIFIYHSGIQYREKAYYKKLNIMQQIADSGADIVIGHHPHVIQDDYLHTTPDFRQVPIFASLGNFISDQGDYSKILNTEKELHEFKNIKRAEGMVLQCKILFNKLKVSQLTFSHHPVFTVRKYIKSKKNNTPLPALQNLTVLTMDDIIKKPCDEISNTYSHCLKIKNYARLRKEELLRNRIKKIIISSTK